MKKTIQNWRVMRRTTLLALLCVASAFGLSSFEILNSTGKAGYTGSSGETTCVTCHSGTALNAGGGSVSLTSTMNNWQYSPGVTYQISVTVTQQGTSLFGFGFEALNANNANSGTLAAIANSTDVQILNASNGRANMTHKSNGGAGTGTKTFTFNWTAPTTLESVNFYATGNATNSSGSSAGDKIYSTTKTATPAVTVVATASASAVCAGSSVTLTASASPSTGVYTYVWGVNGTAFGTTQTVTATPTATTTYVVTATSATGATATASQTVVVNSRPTPTVASFDACAGSSVTLRAASPNGATYSSYFWSYNQATTQGITVSPTTTTNYTVTVTDANGCTGSATGNVTTLPLPAFQISQQGSVCNGQVVSLSAVGGTGNSYQWSVAGSSGATVTTAIAGTYTVTASSTNGCTATGTTTVAPCTTNTIVFSGGNSVCAGKCVSITAALSGGGNATFNWGTALGTGATKSLCPTATTVYSVTATDANQATTIGTITIQVLPAINASITGDGTICSNTPVTLTAGGGATYLWSNGNTTAIITATSAATYTVTATSQSGCTATATKVIATGSVPSATITQSGSLCTTPPSVVLTAPAATGTAPNTYSWNTQATTQGITATTAGTYTCSVTNASGCRAIGTVVVAACTPPTVTITGNTTLCAPGCTSLTATASPPTANYSYSWSNQTTTPATQACVTAGSGIFTVTVMNTATGASAIKTVTVTVSAVTPPQITSNVSPLTCTQPVAVLSAANANYTFYSWSMGGTASTVSVTSPSTYTVTVGNSASCTATASFVLTANKTAPTTPTITQSGTLCSPNGVNLTAAGTAISTIFSWNTQAITQSINVLTAGTYTVIATNDVNGCTASATSSVAACAGLTVTTTGNAIICRGGISNCTSVSATAAGSAGTTVSYAWGNNITGATVQLCPTVTTTYTVTATASTGATGTASLVVTVATAPNAAITAGNTSLTCSSPFTVLTASGGNTYQWSSAQTGNAITVTSANTYTVTVTNSSGCSATASISLLSNFTIPTANAGLDQTLTCTRTSVVLGTTNGATNLSYSWNTQATTPTITVTAGGTYTVTVTNPANGCTASDNVVVTVDRTAPTTPTITQSGTLCSPNGVNLAAAGTATNTAFTWNTQATTQSINVLNAGIYTVIATNSANGCTASATSSVAACAGLAVTTIGGNTVICNGGISNCTSVSAIATGSAGTAFSYAWSNGARGATVQLCPTITTTYTVTATASTGATGTASLVVTVATAPTAAITAGNTSLTCRNPSAVLTASSGLSAYQWSNGQTGSAITVTSASTYTVTVTNQAGCSATASITLSSDFTPPTANAGIDQTLTCTNPSVILGTTSGATSVSYAWSTQATTPTITVTAAGTYTVTVTNLANGCSASDNVMVTVNRTAPTATISSSATTNCGAANLTASTSGTGNTFRWNNQSTTATINVATSGTYTVTVTNGANGCTGTSSITINAAPAATITQTTSGCPGVPVRLMASGGGSYAWSNQARTESVSVLPDAVYTVTVTGTNGCTRTATIAAVSVSSPSCNGTGSRTSGITHAGVFVYPNPGSSACTINMSGVLGEAAEISVFDVNGRKIAVHQQDLRESTELTLETATWFSGIYLIQVKRADRVETLKWIKE